MNIQILIDEQPRELPAGSNLAELLALLQREPRSVATAVNGRFVAREARPATMLAEGDQVLLFQPIVGG